MNQVGKRSGRFLMIYYAIDLLSLRFFNHSFSYSFALNSFAHDRRFGFQLGTQNAVGRRRPHRIATAGPRQLCHRRLPSGLFHRQVVFPKSQIEMKHFLKRNFIFLFSFFF